MGDRVTCSEKGGNHYKNGNKTQHQKRRDDKGNQFFNSHFSSLDWGTAARSDGSNRKQRRKEEKSWEKA